MPSASSFPAELIGMILQEAIDAGEGDNYFPVIAKLSDRPRSSFRDGPKDQTRNLEVPGSPLRAAPE
jgi:hypothetical protein